MPFLKTKVTQAYITLDDLGWLIYTHWLTCSKKILTVLVFQSFNY